MVAGRRPDVVRGWEYLGAPLPRVIAHRGLALSAPENTIEAFRAALAAGATHLETDVQLSADGVAVLAHDPDLTRLIGRTTGIDALTIGELGEIDLGGGAHVPTLAAALAEFPTALFNIDVKASGAEDATARAIIEAEAGPRVLVTSFSGRRRRRTIAGVPSAATSASPIGVALAALGAALGARWLVRRALRGIDAVQVPPRFGRLPLVTGRFVRAVHAVGVEVHVWTINEPSGMRAMFAGGVDGIVTDRCDIARQIAHRT